MYITEKLIVFKSYLITSTYLYFFDTSLLFEFVVTWSGFLSYLIKQHKNVGEEERFTINFFLIK